MKTEKKNLGKCQIELTVNLDAAEVKAAVSKIEKGFVREVQLPGFRKGKVPLELVRRNFAAGIKEEVNRELLRTHYDAAVKAEQIDEVALTNVKEISYDDNGGYFCVVVDIKPVFKLPTYKGLKVSTGDVTIGDDKVEEQVANMRKSFAKYEDAKEGEAVAEGDYIQIDYDGTVDGKPILEINPKAAVVAKGTGFWVQVEEGRFLPEILDAVKGMKVGETKSGVRAKFAKEAAPEGLEGAEAEYTVTLKSFRRQILPEDAELVEKIKEESMDKLRAKIREALEKRAVEAESVRRENEAVELLMKKVDFDVPPCQVARMTERYLAELEERAKYTGLPAEYFEKNREQIMKDATEKAEKQVRLWYVIDAIAAEEKLEAKEDERGKKVIDLILANAK